MTCSACGAANHDGKKYCGDCGVALDAQSLKIESIVNTQVEKAIQAQLKDQHVVDVETSQAIAERMTKWGKIFAGVIALPAAVLVAILVVSGIESYRDFKAKIAEVESQVQPQIDHAKKVAEDAQKVAAEAKSTGDEAKSMAADAKAEAVSSKQAIESASADARRQMAVASQQVQGSSGKLDSQMADLNLMMEGATKKIATQEAQLESSDELLKTLFSKGTTQIFPTNINGPNVVVAPHKNGALVFVLLNAAPIYQTTQVQWRVFVQPRGSYLVENNLLTFIWGDTGQPVSQNPLEITYVPDPTIKTPPFKKLTVKDNILYVDDVKKMDLPAKPQ